MSWNITAITFATSTIVSLYICIRAFFVWKQDRESEISKTFVYIFVFLTPYMGIRAFASLFFFAHPTVLTIDYIVSHVFLGIAASYVAKLGLTPVVSAKTANAIFLLFLILFAFDVALTMLLPNNPSFDKNLNIIDWGTNNTVGILHTLLLWGTFLLSAAIFLFKTIQCCSVPLLRARFLLMSMSLILAILIVIPRNIFHTPGFIFVSDVGFVVSFFFALWGISWKEKRTELPAI